jgi:septum site-determining protein MinD
MAKIISIHSFLRGVGKSNLVANLAALLAAEGRRVGVVDTDLESPTLHLLFGLGAEAMTPSLNDYLRGEAAIEQTVRDVTPYVEVELIGRVFVVPASSDHAEIARGLRGGYNLNLLNDGVFKLLERLRLDVLLLDTHAGLSEATLLCLALSDATALVLQLDRQGYQGTSVIVAVAHRLDVPRLALIVNQVSPQYSAAEVKTRVEQTYHVEVIGVLPHSDELQALASAGLFALRYPDHPLTAQLKQTAARLME